MILKGSLPQYEESLPPMPFLVDDFVWPEDDLSPSPTERINQLEPRVEALENELGIQRNMPAPPWYKRFWKAVSAHPATSSVVAIVLFVLSIASTQIKGCFSDAVDHHIEAALSKPDGVNERLKAIETQTTEINATLKTLQPFIQDLVRHQFDTVSKLSSQELGERLPAIADLLSVARDQGIDVQPQESDRLRKNLLLVPSATNGYWSATAEFVSYRTSSRAVPHELPDCGLNGNVPKVVFTGGPKTDDMVGDSYFENCFLDMDKLFGQDVPGAAVTSSGDGRAISHYRLHLTNVAVQYDGSPLKSFDRITFTDCVFNFKIIEPPKSPFGKTMIEKLLASENIKHVEVGG